MDKKEDNQEYILDKKESVNQKLNEDEEDRYCIGKYFPYLLLFTTPSPV